MFVGCSDYQKIIYRTKYKTRKVHSIDSIYIHNRDSFFIMKENDTVYIRETRYRDKKVKIFVHDTIVKNDTIYIYKNVKQTNDNENDTIKWYHRIYIFLGKKIIFFLVLFTIIILCWLLLKKWLIS